ncbi:MAG TPA: ECF-type sigma factor [Thermoanaerobaculia bacterium]|nr:ECF-type sigma factor [Thermoanaerobaculia bacterium]HQN08287.1 ECF-type sigma factor [Thermoanaerobaculia bacterium]HQP87167.1 ECF-type sigma factor [Thermoanaerobaculia bacterium]
MAEPISVTALLRAHAAGEEGAFDRLLPLVYEELRKVARRQLRRGGGAGPLVTTELVHEAYLRLAGQDGLRLEDRRHLLAVSALAMRQIVVGQARARYALKRGAGVPPVPLDEEATAAAADAEWLLDLDRALERLRDHDEKLAAIVDCRYFAGMSEEETSEALGLSLRSTQRGWMKARAWLRSALEGGTPEKAP